jgi:parvulin-like peptidyl-prolyl isomerase
MKMNMNMKQLLPVLLLTVVASLFSCTQGPGKLEEKKAFPEAQEVVARVNGEPVYASSVLRRMQAAYNGDLEEVKQDPNRWEMLEDVATETEVMDELLLQAAVADGISVSQEKAGELLEEVRKTAGDDAFAAMLKEQGAEEEKLRKFLVKRELINRYREKLFAGMAINESALQEYYEGHAETFMEMDQVRLEILTLGVGETAEKMYDRWNGGESFDSIAKTYFDEGEQVGRRTRWMPVGAIPPELQQKVIEVDAGTILEPQKVAGKYYVVRVVEKRGARVRSFEEVQDEVAETILNLRKNKVLDEWYKRASQTAQIEYVH